jgi:hypothetical protein
MILAGLTLALTVTGCGWFKPKLEPARPTFNTAPTGAKSVVYKAAIVLRRPSNGPLIGRMGELYLNTLVGIIDDAGPQITLLKPGQPDYPTFMAFLAQPGGALTGAVGEEARRLGFQGVIVAAVSDLRPQASNWSFLWVTRTTHRLLFNVTFDLFDPVTGAKIVHCLKEVELKISSDDYESFNDGTATELEAVNDAVIGAAKDFGKQAAKALVKQPWKTTVLSVDGNYLHLAADNAARLPEAGLLAIYEGGRKMRNRFGENFIIPGVKIAEVNLAGMTDGQVIAEAPSEGGVKPGDVAVLIP